MRTRRKSKHTVVTPCNEPQSTGARLHPFDAYDAERLLPRCTEARFGVLEVVQDPSLLEHAPSFQHARVVDVCAIIVPA